MIRLVSLLTASCMASLLPCSAQAQETITYTYDELGRLKTVSSSGSVNNGQTTSVTFDAAGNRTNYTVSGSPNGSGNGNGGGASVGQRIYIVVPLNGYTLIPINR